MALEYSAEFCRNLQTAFERLGLSRPFRTGRYESGTELYYDLEPMGGREKVGVKLAVEIYAGSGFAGQVYRVKILEIDEPQACPGLTVGGIYAMKILVPASGFSRLFRNLLYWAGFSSPFQLQVNPAAAKAGALWQKFIRRAAKIRFGDERSVVDIFGTFVDSRIGSCGELREWVEGRTWRLEVDEYVDLLRRWRKNKKVDYEKLGSPEYRAKYTFMHKFVKLLHDVGACEFARQYEWTTLKSQPNCLKRFDTQAEPEKGLVAVDFRPGLALLPFLPMSPGDVKLIFDGIKRGSLVQFDRGDLNKLKSFIDGYKEDFSDMQGLFEELAGAEEIYRNSMPDITHNRTRLLYDRKLWATIFDNAVVGWKIKNIIDENGFEKLASSRIKTFIFFLLGLLPVLGGVLRKFWCNDKWRRHYIDIFTEYRYFDKALKGRIIELLISWHRAGRLPKEKAEKFLQQSWRILYHLPFLLLISAKLHRLLTDWQFAKEKLYFLTVRPVKLYFNAALRAQWLSDMVSQGKKKHILTDEDADIILSQIDEPFIQKYLQCLAVHICCMPVTHIVAVIVAAIFWITHHDNPNAWVIGLGIIAAFQLVPVSPGSLVRGIYVVYVAIRDRSFKDYNIAVFLAFLKYVGYLAFPIQMTYRYPTIARFMATHWATDAVHTVPVFGESGALLEHGIFCVFYNWPLTIRRRMRARAAMREKMLPRRWHIILTAFLASFALLFLYSGGLRLGIAGVLICLACGVFTTIYCGKTSLLKRFAYSAGSGALTAVLYLIWMVFLPSRMSTSVAAGPSLWLCFIAALLSVIGAILTELSLPDVENQAG